MTFLNPLYLIALAAAAIPILLHLLNLRKTRVIEFSTLSFLKELQRSKIRKLKIRQWLLLVLRTLVIVFIVFAFTRPAMRSGLGFLPGSQARTSVVIVLDDSFSMFASDDEGRLFKQAKEKAKAILDVLQPGDEAALIRMSEARKENQRFTGALSAVRAEIDAAEPTFKHVDAGDALTAASVLLGQTHNINREVYVISDDQRSHYVSGTKNAPPRLFDGSIKVFLVPLGTKRIENTAVTNVTVKTSLFEKGKPVDIDATILNDGTSPIVNGIVSIFLNGERMLQKSVNVDAGGSRLVSFTVIPNQIGFMDGFVELEDDAIPEDNRRYFAMYIPQNIRILLASSASQDATIFKLALQPITGEEGGATYSITAADRSAVAAQDFARFDVIVLPGVSFLSPSTIERLVQYARSGGGVLALPDGDGNTATFATVFLPAFGLPQAAGTTGTLGNTSTYSSFGKIDFDHPLFRGVFAGDDTDQKPEIESPRLYHTVRLRADEHAEAVVRTGNGDAFLLDRRVGQGRLLAFAVAPNLQWSDFPLKGIFVPLLNRSMFLLAARADNVLDEIVGRTFDVLIPPSGATRGIFDLTAPGGATTRITPKTFSSGFQFTLSNLDKPGVYDIDAEGLTLRSIPLNLDPAESKMEKISAEERDAYYRSIGIVTVHVLERNANILATVTQARFGVELWKYMLALALLCAALEMLISRGGRSAQPETPS